MYSVNTRRQREAILILGILSFKHSSSPLFITSKKPFSREIIIALQSHQCIFSCITKEECKVVKKIEMCWLFQYFVEHRYH